MKNAVFSSFFRRFFYRLGSILRNSKNDLNKVPTTSTLLPETYPIRANRSIISGRNFVFIHKKKKSHIIVKPIHSSLRSKSKIIIWSQVVCRQSLAVYLEPDPLIYSLVSDERVGVGEIVFVLTTTVGRSTLLPKIFNKI